MKQPIYRAGTSLPGRLALNNKGKLMQKVQSETNREIFNTPPETGTRLTRALLTLGIAAGPLYLAVGLAQALTRPGFDITRHSLSLLSNGTLGWIHMTNLVVTGLLVLAGARGMQKALAIGPGKTWGPVLVAIYGLGLIGSGFFTADPALGFPPGTAVDANTVSWHGLMHFACGGIGFLALIAACFLFARRFAVAQQRGWAMFSRITGVVFLAAFLGIASGSGNSWTILGFWIGVILAWAWFSMLLARLMGKLV